MLNCSTLNTVYVCYLSCKPVWVQVDLLFNQIIYVIFNHFKNYTTRPFIKLHVKYFNPDRVL